MNIIEKKVGKKDAKVRYYIHPSYGNEGNSEIVIPKKHRAILVIPGGGYNHVSDREAEPVALAFYARGYEAAVLDYSVGESIRDSDPIAEAAEAVSLFRSFESVEDDKVSAIGFSAGGHLAAMLAEYGKNFSNNAKLNALILSYPVITMLEHAHAGSRDMITQNDEKKRNLYSAELHVEKDFPPSFIWSTRNDRSVDVENSLMMYEAIIARDIYSELHIYPDGRHGSALATKETGVDLPYVSSWLDEALKFLDSVYLR